MEPDQLVQLGGAGAAYLLTLHPLVRQVLGPTADYLGDEFKLFTRKRLENIGRILEAAHRKQRPVFTPDASVPPKVIQHVLTEGSFCDDELSAEYFGGVLASSRSTVNRDDRAATLLSLLGRLSTYQIRTHYILYVVFKRLFNESVISIANAEGRYAAEVFIPFYVYERGMEFSGQEDAGTILTHTLFGLQGEDLLENFHYGERDYLVERFPQVPAPGILASPSTRGVELFLWAHGRSDIHPNQFFDKGVVLQAETDVEIPDGAVRVRA